MSKTCAASTGKIYGLARVCRVWGIARANVYRHLSPARQQALRRGPKPLHTDEQVLAALAQLLQESRFVSEGYRKYWAKLRFIEVRLAPCRVLRLMRENNLLAPTRAKRARGPRNHDGTIKTNNVNEIWGTDMTTTLTREGNASIFFAIDHCSLDVLGIHAAARGTRFEALEPIRQGVRTIFGGFEGNIAQGLSLRHDHGSQYISLVFQEELQFLGIKSSPSYVREPQGNGIAERFVRVLKENLLWLQQFDTVDDLNKALQQFMQDYNTQWLIGRHGYKTPAAFRNYKMQLTVAA